MSNHHNRTRKYGYQWWLKEFRVGDSVSTVISAHGRGGQAIFVLPDQNAVVVLTAGHYDDNKAASAESLLLEKAIHPVLISRHAEIP